VTLIVRMHVYSGRPDPEWVISGDNEQELRRMYSSAGGGISPHVVGRLGYRGFTVTETAGGADPRHLFTVQQAGAAPAPSHSIAGVPELEAFLLWTGHEHVSDILAVHVQDVLQQPVTASPEAPGTGCPHCVAHDAPPYNPGFWNIPARQPYNNCYNYANNQATNTFAQPGRATGHPYASLDCAGVRPAAQSDGLVPSANFTHALAAGAGWYVALVIWPGNDYHWYRQDQVGCWSHKPGGTAARNVDNAGHAFHDPRTCNRGPYTVFCTFMVTKSTVHIR
jgi:hypothetical protein